MPSWLADGLAGLAAAPVATFLRESSTAYVIVNAAHILAIGLIIGSIAALDIRVLGAFRSVPLAALAGPLSRVAATGVLAALATGLLLFSVRPLAYVENPAFLAKLSLVALGVANALLLRINGGWRVAVQGGPVPVRIRIAAALSLLIWTGAVLAGRWIGFLQ